MLASSYAADPPNYWGYIGVSNIWVVNSTYTGSSNTFWPGRIGLRNAGEVIIGMTSDSSGGAYVPGSGEFIFACESAYTDGHYNGFQFDTNVTIRADLWVDGNIHSVSNLLWVTNNIMVTNATWANNVWYPTNQQTSVDINMGIAYSDYDTAVAPTFTVNGNALSPTNYQTAVVFVRQNPPSANVLALSIPAEASRQGTFNLTNVTVLTWFYNPHIPLTNVVALPLY